MGGSVQVEREGCTRLIALLLCLSQVKRQLDSCIFKLLELHIVPKSEGESVNAKGGKGLWPLLLSLKGCKLMRIR